MILIFVTVVEEYSSLNDVKLKNEMSNEKKPTKTQKVIVICLRVR